MSKITLPAHETCRHRGYRMTCDQFEALVAEFPDERHACAAPAAKNGPYGKLAGSRAYKSHTARRAARADYERRMAAKKASE